MPDITNQQLLTILREEFATKKDIKDMATKADLKAFATKDDLKLLATQASLDRIERKLDSHKLASTEHHLKILDQMGGLNQRFDKLSETQVGLGKRFNKLRIVTE